MKGVPSLRLSPLALGMALVLFWPSCRAAGQDGAVTPVAPALESLDRNAPRAAHSPQPALPLPDTLVVCRGTTRCWTAADEEDCITANAAAGAVWKLVPRAASDQAAAALKACWESLKKERSRPSAGATPGHSQVELR